MSDSWLVFCQWYWHDSGWVWFVIVSAAVISAWCAFDIWREDRKHRKPLPRSFPWQETRDTLSETLWQSVKRHWRAQREDRSHHGEA